MRVLFVDDDSSCLKQAKTFLEDGDDRLDIETTISASEGLELLDEYDFDAIVSDYQMPEMDGLEFLKTIREERNDDIPFIIFTGKGREEVAMKALNLGANRYLQKKGDPKSRYGELARSIVQEVERYEDKEAFEESEERYRRLFETAQDGMLILDAETGEVKDANPYIQDLTGYSKEELTGRELWEIGTFNNIVENRERFEELVKEGFIRYEDLPLETKEGEEAQVEFVSNTYEVGGEKVIQCNIRDITERKKVEEREEFLHSLLRHDLKNKVQVVRGYLKKLEELDFSGNGREYLREAINVTNSERDLIKKIRKLRKVEEAESRTAEIGEVLEQVINKNKTATIEKGIQLEKDITYCEVKGGPLLEELFSNLVENSVVHSGCDKIRLEMREDGDRCVVSVIDDGRGIPDKKKDRIFNRGFKEGEESGFGLGLYLVKRIVDNYDGEIEVKDSEESGARFDVFLRKSENLND